MRKSYKHISTILFIILLIQVLDVNAQRFPKPEFESGYVQESVQAPVPRSDFMEYFDVLVLIVAMSVVSWFVLKKDQEEECFGFQYFQYYILAFTEKGVFALLVPFKILLWLFLIRDIKFR